MMSSDISSWGFTWKVEQICAKDSQDGADLGGKKTNDLQDLRTNINVQDLFMISVFVGACAMHILHYTRVLDIPVATFAIML